MTSQASLLVRGLVLFAVTALPAGCSYPIVREVDVAKVDTATARNIVGVTNIDGTEIEFTTSTGGMFYATVVKDTLHARVQGTRHAFPLTGVDKLWVEELYTDYLASGTLAVVIVGGVVSLLVLAHGLSGLE